MTKSNEAHAVFEYTLAVGLDLIVFLLLSSVYVTRSLFFIFENENCTIILSTGDGYSVISATKK